MEHFSFGGWEGVYADHDSNDSQENTNEYNSDSDSGDVRDFV